MTLDQRCTIKHRQCVRAVPWSRGKEDVLATQETSNIVHRAHLTKKDFDKFGFADRCPVCSAIIRGLRSTARTEKYLEDEWRVMCAKVRVCERSRSLRDDKCQVADHERRILDDIEDAVMHEEYLSNWQHVAGSGEGARST